MFSNRCARCFMRRLLCVCELVPRLELRTRVTVVMHYREALKTTNTGRLAALSLVNSELRLRGERGRAMEAGDLADASVYQPLLHFPAEEARELTREYVEELGRPVHLLVPDGNWNQARRVAKREGALRGVPRVRLRVAPVGVWAPAGALRGGVVDARGGRGGARGDRGAGGRGGTRAAFRGRRRKDALEPREPADRAVYDGNPGGGGSGVSRGWGAGEPRGGVS